ncbi:LLM class flavin-dependent oxidoreductase [Cryobacterium sp. TMS1-20-1]|uniref:LLM class flavin-dependent oxidoreductase n=1 Tax=Cryobacterium sp. TMS1-20-1 TaxID=1259223 RepID=UPI001068E6FE|nr:LLM class flavin-dependent oxidoreductase [Cryobacterium sp. TMS1-20-1]TFC75863.1 LLM class flavin-dependent oxidoreductase [Cryobacterium sp. TMS1-20-1]
MKAAMFQTPFLPPTRSSREVFRWAVEQAVVADQAGLAEYWIGEHAMQSWESIPNPELIIAAAALETENIKFAPGAHLLPYHQPGSLALQVAFLSNVLEGRYILGIGAGAYPDDAVIRGITDMSWNHEMEIESIELMERIWSGQPFHQEGKFFKAGFPENDPGHPHRDTRPWGGSIEIGVTGLSANSPSIKFAGERGYLPISVYSGDKFVRQHWNTYEEAAVTAGRTPDRASHHVVRDVFIADTDKEARRLAVEGGMGRAWEEYLLPVYKRFGILGGLLHDESIDPADVNAEYLADHVWFVGSAETVTEKIQEFADSTGGFGTLMPYSYDYIDNPEPWNNSLEILGREIMPKIIDPVPALVGSVA